MSDEVLEVKRAIKLSDYMKSQGVTFGKSGGNGTLMAFCPFHDNNKTPAMSVRDDVGGRGGAWKCFAGCGSGSVFDFWLRINNADDSPAAFRDALVDLATFSGVVLPERAEHEGPGKGRILEALKAVTAAASGALFEDGRKDFQHGWEYLTKQRFFPEADIEAYQMGVIPSGAADKFILKACQGDAEAAIGGGLLYRNNDGSLWSPYRGRLVLPIYDAKGAVVGLAGRQIPGVPCHGEGKWINPSETAVYSKSKVMYGLQRLSKVTRRALIVEGYFDVMAAQKALEAAEVTDTVALAACGTSLTAGQASLLRDMEKVELIFDGDDAGRKAVVSSVWLADSIPGETGALLLPEGEDPGSLVYGTETQEPSPRGTRRHLLERSNSAPLIEVATKLVAERGEAELDKWAAATLGRLTRQGTKDHLLRAAAEATDRSVTSYARTIAELGVRRREHAESEDGTPSLSPAFETWLWCVSALDDLALEDLFADLRDMDWREATEGWIPLSTEDDRQVFSVICLGLAAERGANDVLLREAILRDFDTSACWPGLRASAMTLALKATGVRAPSWAVEEASRLRRLDYTKLTREDVAPLLGRMKEIALVCHQLAEGE